MTDTANPTPATGLDINAIVSRYIQMRDMKKALKDDLDKKTAKLDEAMDKCEAVIMNHLNSTGSESIKTAAGTVFKQQVTSATVADWEMVLNWIRDQGNWAFLERKVNKTAVKEFMEANAKALPPGVNWAAINKVMFRR